MEPTLVYSNDDIFTSQTSNQTSIVDKAQPPYEIPKCPAGVILQDLYYLPDETVETFFYNEEDKILIRYVYSTVVAIGLTTNLLFLWTLARISQMRTTTNFYLANLACADLIFILSKAVSAFYKFIWSSDINRLVPWKSAAACASITTVAYIGYFGSMSLVTLVSIERFFAICLPLKHRMMNTKARTVAMAVGAWFIAISFALLVAPNWGKLRRYCVIWPDKYQNRLPVVVSICTPVLDEWQNVVGILEIVPYIVSLGMSTVLYILIIRRLSQRDISEGGGGDGDKTDKATKVRNAVARMLILNGIIYFLCLSPYQFTQMYYFIVRFTDIHYFDNNTMQIVGYVARVLDLVNSSINPIIYSATNVRYRKAFIRAITCISTKKKPVDDAKSISEITKTSKI